MIKNKKHWLGLCAVLALALPVVGATAGAVGGAKAYGDALARLTPWQRHAALRRAVLDSGERCKRVTAAAAQGRWGNLAMWATRCEVGGDYGVFIGPDGSVQVRRCEEMRKLRLPACRKL